MIFAVRRTICKQILLKGRCVNTAMKAVMSITVLYCSLALFKINNFIEILSCTTKCHSAPHKHLTFKHIKNNSNITELFERVKLVVVFMQNKKTTGNKGIPINAIEF